MPPTKPKHPWGRQPNETPKAWHAFTLYRDLGPTRSIDKAWQLHKNNLKTTSKRPQNDLKKRPPPATGDDGQPNTTGSPAPPSSPTTPEHQHHEHPAQTNMGL